MLANELREELVYTVSKTGGHLSSSLGVAELTVALHHVFNTPEDKIIWDVGHQVVESTLLDLYNIIFRSLWTRLSDYTFPSQPVQVVRH